MFGVANSALVDHIVFAHNGLTVMTTSNKFDNLNRLTGISSASSASSVVNFQYQYNLAGQRTRVSLPDGSYWLYGYDALGQVTNSVKYFSDGTPYAGQQFGFGFDTIGNRLVSLAGGDSTWANLRLANYTNNALNQITSRDVPGFVDVMGLTLSSNTVKVNNTNAYQKWEYFREQIGTNNTSAPQWVGINVTAPGQTPVSGGVFLAQTPETNFTYDLDGNLTRDGRWTYTWDAENRLISMTSLPNAPLASQYSLSFAYDYMGRRIQKIVSTNSASGYVPQYTNVYVYDGWNLIGVLTPQSAVVASMMWGLDLSGSLQGAGGVGGLLAENLAGNGAQFVVYDGAGNVSALVSATNGAVTATYEYGPFGELTRATGPTSKLNEVMYQSQICDWESGKYYWKYRYYDTSTGRWLNHDPIGESGGANLYAFVGNNPDNVIDATGLNGYPPNFIGPLQPGDVRGPFLPNPNQKPPNWNPSWPTGSDGRGEYTEDPNTGTRYYPHDEDPRHWPHYDDSKGKSYPEKCVKPRPGQKRKPFGDQSPTDPWPQPTQSFWHYVHPIDSWTVNPFGLASGLGATATAGAVVATSEGTVSTPWWLLIFGW